MFTRRRRRRVLRDYRQRRSVDAAPELGASLTAARRRRRQPREGDPLGTFAASVATHRSRLVSAVGAALVALGLIYLALSPRYYVHGAEILGAARLDGDALYRASGVEGRHIFHVDQRQVAQRLEALDSVQRARVVSTLPNRVAIRIDETPLALIWETPGGRVAVDAGGRLEPPPSESAGLLVVRSDLNPTQPPSRGIDADRLRAAIAFGQAFGSPLTFRDGAGFVHVTPEGWEVWLGEDADIAQTQRHRLDALRPVLVERARLRPVEMVDLRFDQWYYRLHGETP